MRALAVAACLATFLLPGCISDLGGPLSDSRQYDCTPNVASDVATELTTIYPAAATMGPSPVANPRVTVPVREGQTLVASVTWQGMGEVEVAYDGPEGEVQSAVANTWSMVVQDAPAGNVTLGLDGAPLAQVTYTLSLVTSGCSPRA